MKLIEINRVQSSQDGDLIWPEATECIENDNWNYPIDSKVRFGMAYDESAIYLSYSVKENHPKAVHVDVNASVWEDSCVEFFIKFNDKGYYNLEFNCIGNKLVGYGSSNQGRTLLDEHVVNTIKVNSTLGNKPVSLENTPTLWSLDIRVPVSIFKEIRQFKSGQEFNVNFFKCGDKQKVPHFLSWSPIVNDIPNFHLPSFFGRLKLV